MNRIDLKCGSWPGSLPEMRDMQKARAPMNRTLTCPAGERARLSRKLARVGRVITPEQTRDLVVNQDFFEAAAFLPHEFVDLLILDPPYNLSKNYHGNVFGARDGAAYTKWFAGALARLRPMLKRTASIYVCADWRTSLLIAPMLEREFILRNRITWEREKGRGAKANWKNNTEDIWFCTVSNEYYFDIEAVKLKRRVLAPYRDGAGQPKDWREEMEGNFRRTHPSNVWTDITVPFWSMPENTDHPTQKSEKLIAKLVLASAPPGGFVLDPFAGSGTTAVVCRKLGRHFLTIEQNREYCCWTLKRLEKAKQDSQIQGYRDGVFWERNAGQTR